nr:APC family permease [Ktedonobacterales bacterium]
MTTQPSDMPTTLRGQLVDDLPPAQDKLHANSLGLPHAIIISVAVMSPAASVFFNTVPQGAAVGAAIPLCYLVGFVISLLVANSYSEFSREIPSSGSSYTFITQGIGPRFGFMSAWVGLLAVTLGVPYTFIGLASNLQFILRTSFGFNVHWSFYFILLLGIAFAICYSGIRQSLNVDFTFLAVEIGVCLLLVIIVLLSVGQHGGLTAAPFTLDAIPSGGQGFTFNLITGVILGVLSYIGFETAASLGSETRNAHRNIPIAVFGSMVIVGVFYLLMVYTETVGYGIDKIAPDFASNSGIAPFHVISQHFSPWLTIFVDLVGVFSFFSAGIAILNGSARILFTVAREGLLPGFLGYLHPTRRTPVGAVTALCLGGGVIGLIIGFLIQPTNAFAFFATLDALSVIIIYALVCVGTFFFFRRQGRGHFKLVRHAVMPFGATFI